MRLKWITSFQWISKTKQNECFSRQMKITKIDLKRGRKYEYHIKTLIKTNLCPHHLIGINTTANLLYMVILKMKEDNLHKLLIQYWHKDSCLF